MSGLHIAPPKRPLAKEFVDDRPCTPASTACCTPRDGCISRLDSDSLSLRTASTADSTSLTACSEDAPKRLVVARTVVDSVVAKMSSLQVVEPVVEESEPASTPSSSLACIDPVARVVVNDALCRAAELNTSRAIEDVAVPAVSSTSSSP